MLACSQLNTVSRTRSGVGRTCVSSGIGMRRPRQSPAMIRTLPGGPRRALLRLGMCATLTEGFYPHVRQGASPRGRGFEDGEDLRLFRKAQIAFESRHVLARVGLARTRDKAARRGDDRR